MRRTVIAIAAIAGVFTLRFPAGVVITGVIRDPATNAPIAGALVSINGELDSVMTDAAGRYSLRRPTRAEVTLGVRRSGYLAMTVPMVTIGTDTLHFDADMHSDPAALSERGVARPLFLIRRSLDTLTVAIGDSAYLWRKLAPDSMIAEIEVIKRRTARSVAYGPAAQAAGLVRIWMKKAGGFGFGG